MQLASVQLPYRAGDRTRQRCGRGRHDGKRADGAELQTRNVSRLNYLRQSLRKRSDAAPHVTDCTILARARVCGRLQCGEQEKHNKH